MKPKPPDRQLPAVRKVAPLERSPAMSEAKAAHEKRIIVVHDFQWHRIISALALLILALATVAQRW
jgi:hypothetical protein